MAATKISAAKEATAASTRKSIKPRTAAKTKLLSGGNPQVAKGTGDARVQAYISAMPGWKQDIGHWLDELVTRTVPGVHKTVKWNTPFYGTDDATWFMGFHCLTKYVKVAFPMGAHLEPMPPGTSKQKNVRYLDLYEDGEPDAKRMAAWIKQAAKLPGEQW